MKSEVEQSALNCKLKIKVIPGAASTKISGWLGDALKVRVAAPAEKGKANAAMEKIICQALNLSSGAVQVESGLTSPHKVVTIEGISRAEMIKRLAF